MECLKERYTCEEEERRRKKVRKEEDEGGMGNIMYFLEKQNGRRKVNTMADWLLGKGRNIQ